MGAMADEYGILKNIISPCIFTQTYRNFELIMPKVKFGRQRPQ